MRMHCSLIAMVGLAWIASVSDASRSLRSGATRQTPGEQQNHREELKAALKRALEPEVAWTATAREICEDIKSDGEPQPRSPADAASPPREVELVVAGTNAAMKPSAPSGQLLASGLNASGGWTRTAEGMSVGSTPNALVLINLPVLLPTSSTMRIIGIPSESLWTTVERSHVAPDVDQFVVRTSVVRGGIGEYTFRFRAVGESVVLAGVDWAGFQLRDGAEPLKVVSVSISALQFAALGGVAVPTRLERRAFLKDDTGRMLGNQVCRLEITGLRELSKEAAMERIMNASTPLLGESVFIEQRSLRFIIGETWIEVAGVRMNLKAPIRTVPTPEELEDLLKTATPGTEFREADRRD